MKKLFFPIFSLAFFAAFIIITSSVFVVDQRNTALVIQFGKITREISEPGLYFKLPLIQRTVMFDKRMLTLDESESTRVTTQEKSDLLVDMFVKWKIADAKSFYTQLRSIPSAQSRIAQVINAKLREEFGKRKSSEVIGGQRDDVMAILQKDSSAELKSFGIEIVDVRLKGVEFPQNVLASAFDRMRAERLRVANERRSNGAADSERLRAEADKQSQIILAEAGSKAQKLKGEGDAQATKIYAKAFQNDPEFYAFYKSMQTYEQSLGGRGDVMVLDPKSKFFRYFSGGK